MKCLSYTFLAVLTVDLLATSGDITMTWTSPVLPKLYSEDAENPLGTPITPNEESWIGALINIGAMIGPFPCSLISEKFGRKRALLAIAIPFVVSFLTLAFVRDIYSYYFARFLAGFGVGGSCTILPMYIAEVAEDSNRGTLSVTLPVFWSLGNLIPYLIGPYLSIFWFNIAITCVPVTFFVLFLIIGPETPYFLVSRNRLEEAEKSLMLLRTRDKSQVQEEICHIQKTLAQDELGKFTDLFTSKTNLKALGISLFLIAMQQLCGINVVVFYTQLIFESAGTNIPAEISAIIIGLVLFISSFVTPILAEKLGRKVFLMGSAFGMSLSLGAFGAYFHLKDFTDFSLTTIYWLPILSLVMYIIAFNFGFASMPWTVTSELFPASVKGTAASLVTLTCWLASFAVTKFFNDLVLVLGTGGTFWLFGGFALVALLFTYSCVPETRGKGFDEIQSILAGQRNS